ncbi:glycoside hydrolase family 16 protein [Streptomyces gobitricini]|uniref:GH16 domain-containing protein n=1 Tax=Streptomyces gobitricini TaxID=68211 RepID=A0ABP5ZNF8_9ACTN
MYGRARARPLAVGFGAAAPVVTSRRPPRRTPLRRGRRRPPTAAERYGWGAPPPEWPDGFGYGSEADPAVPDRDKWRLAGGGPGECRPGHSGNVRRCDANTRVVGGVLRMTGEADGDSGWLASPYGRRYGPCEARVRSRATAPDSGRQYHPLLILRPGSGGHPRDGEHDYLENGGPGERCAEAFLHYPYPEDVPVQQEFARKCGVDLSRWHNVAVEWTADHLRGFLDGKKWFRFSGGANAGRDCVPCAPSTRQTIQLDNVYEDGLQSAVFEVDWARVHHLPDSRTKA